MCHSSFMLNDSALKLSPDLGESFKLSPMIGESLKLSPNAWLSPNLGDPPLNTVLLKWATLQKWRIEARMRSVQILFKACFVHSMQCLPHSLQHQHGHTCQQLFSLECQCIQWKLEVVSQGVRLKHATFSSWNYTNKTWRAMLSQHKWKGAVL